MVGTCEKYYEDFTNKWFGNDGELDFTKIKADFNADKCFYFDCVEDASKFRGLRKSDWRVELGFLRNGNKREQRKLTLLLLLVWFVVHILGKCRTPFFYLVIRTSDLWSRTCKNGC